MRRALAVLMMFGLADSPTAFACDVPQPAFEQSYLKRPLRGGQEIRLHVGFGMRYYEAFERRLMHPAVDWTAPTGTKVIAAAAGRVVVAGYHHVIGKTVVIDHGNGWETRYQNLANLTVSSGDCVQRGQVIGTVGNTGQGFHSKVPATSNGTRTVLHYEVLHNGKHRDPLRLK